MQVTVSSKDIENQLVELQVLKESICNTNQRLAKERARILQELLIEKRRQYEILEGLELKFRLRGCQMCAKFKNSNCT